VFPSTVLLGLALLLTLLTKRLAIPLMDLFGLPKALLVLVESLSFLNISGISLCRYTFSSHDSLMSLFRSRTQSRSPGLTLDPLINIREELDRLLPRE
jgi:hypothetical protein